MKRRHYLWTLLLFMVCGAAARCQTTSIRVDAAKPGARISPALYGVFFEEINHAGDGGLYAELVRNRSFEESGEPAEWTARNDAPSTVRHSVESLSPAHPNSPRYLAVRGSGHRFGVANNGYWGMAVRRGEQYRLTLFARAAEGFKGHLTVSLEGADGRTYASNRIGPLTDGWKSYSSHLTPSEDDPKARLVIWGHSSGRFDLDTVSLFPETWKGRKNGLRHDLARLVEQMRPAFVRFPGGCFVEGDRIANAFRWKETIGPIHARKGHLNDIWRYYSSDGLGYHEYLQMCEDLKADAMFVVNCGMAHRDIIPLDQLDPYVQDALDAIEYAIGPVTSKWGAERAKNGHPKPFNLTYVEIGNENGWGDTLPRYEERYARFYDAIKAKYPKIKLIANVPVKSRPMEIVDDHYYMSPEWFMANANRYDNHDRSGPKIYVGEYAVTTGNPGQGNLRAALGEAAWMLGMERNSDVVVMSSYAPLFVNVNDRRWNPDAICFDSSRSYGTPSYHVQALFAKHRPDVNLTTTVTAPPSAALRPTGTIGLGTWRTRAEYRDIRVTQGGRAVYDSRVFNEELWRPVAGRWIRDGGVYRQEDLGEDRRSVLELPALREAGDYTLELKARKLSGDEGFLILFHTRGRDDFYWWNLGGWQNREHGIERGQGGGKSQLVEHVPGRIETDRWYDIRIELTGARIRCYLDGKLVHDVEERAPRTFSALAGLDERIGEIVLKVVNFGPEAHTTRIAVDGVRTVSPQANQIVLTGGPQDENSLDQPDRVKPIESKVSGIGKEFSHTFPPNSLTILRLKATK